MAYFPHCRRKSRVFSGLTEKAVDALKGHDSMRKARTLLLLMCLIGLLSTAHADNVVTLASLEWPPYAGAQLPEQGTANAVVRAAFAAMDFRLDIKFFPWSRAVSLVETQYNYIGYTPEYYSPMMAARFVFSDPICSGRLVLAQRRGSPIRWNTIVDLSAWTVGVVQGHVNGPEFDQRVVDHQQHIDSAPNDLSNLKKLAAGRVDLAIVDTKVFVYLSKGDPSLSEQLELNPKLIASTYFYVAFKRSAQGEYWVKIFNEGLKKIDAAAIMQRYIKD